jgi:hypothetical protein
LQRRGYTPKKRQPGEIHTFAFIPDLGWHRHLLPDLEELGPVSHFDYVAHGYDIRSFAKADAAGQAQRKAMNDHAFEAFRTAHHDRPVDWVFVYASGLEVSRDTVRRITEDCGIPTVNMCLDDKQSWTGPWMGDHPAGQIGIAEAFDLSWTSARVACEWYLVEGGRPIYLPEGFDQKTYRPMSMKQDLAVSFVGGAYGFRPSVIRYLKRHGISVECYGPGWPNGSVWGDEQVGVFNRSRINLGMGGIGYSEALTNVKTRDFEIPGVGGGVYVTSFNQDLAQHFVVGEEILCYRTRDEMLELIRFYLAHPEEAAEIAHRARSRCLREHRWLHRYQKIAQILGLLPALEDQSSSAAS